MFPVLKARLGRGDGAAQVAPAAVNTGSCLLNTKVQGQGPALSPDPSRWTDCGFRACFLGLCQ